jgi:hypothetical protein
VGELNRGYNGDQYVSHFQCRQYLFNLVYTHRHKSDATQLFKKAINTIEYQYNGKVRYIRLDGETSLGNNFETLVIEKGIKPERTAPDTPAQNGGSERSGRVIITKSRTMRIEANLPADLWPEIVKAAGYIENRTPIRKLEWKTPFEAIKKKNPRYAHMYVYGCRAYPLDHHIPKRRKLEPRAHIGYLVGYDSTNIYRIWIPSQRKVIRTRDVTMNNNLLYHPTDLDIGDILKEYADKLIETLDIQEEDEIELMDDNSLVDTLTIEVPTMPEPTKEKSLEDRQLLTPSPTPSESPKPMDFEIVIYQQAPVNDPQTPTNNPQASANLPAAPRNQAI